MQKWSGTIPIAPRGKQRPRLANKGRFAKAYTPAETVKWTKTARLFLSKLWLSVPIPAGEAVGIRITAVHARPQRLLRKKDPEHRLYKPTKPDCDNICKIVLDALNGLAWADDCQVCDEQTIKLWAAKGEQPHVFVEIWRLPCYSTVVSKSDNNFSVVGDLRQTPPLP